MLMVRVCATHMGGFLAPKFSKQGSFTGRFSLKNGLGWVGLAENGKRC